MNSGRGKVRFQVSIRRLLIVAIVLFVGITGFASQPHPARQDPTEAPRPTPTPEDTGTPTPTATSTATEAPTPTDTATPGPPTNTSAPTAVPTVTSTRTTTASPSPTKTATGTPGLEPITPIVTPIWMTGVPTYSYAGTRLPISGVEPSFTPAPIGMATHTQTPVPTLTRPPSPTLTPTATPSDRLGPAAITGLVATAGNGVVVLEWTSSTVPDLDGYRVYRSTAQGSGYSKMVSVDKKFSRYVDNTVVNEVTYYYVVTAFDQAGNESPFSSEVSIMPSALKGMPPSGATLPETIAESPWVWMGALTVTLLVLVGIRRGSLARRWYEMSAVEDAPEAGAGARDAADDGPPE